MTNKSEILAHGYRGIPLYSILQLFCNEQWLDFITIKELEEARIAWGFVKDPKNAVKRGFSEVPYRIQIQEGTHTCHITQEDILAIPQAAERQPQYTLTPELIAKLSIGIPLNSADILQLAIPIAYSSSPIAQIEEITKPMDRVELNGSNTVLTGAIQQLTVFEGYITGKLIGYNDPAKKAEQRLEKVRKALGFN